MTYSAGRSWLRPPPVVIAVAFAIIVGGILVLVSGANPAEAYFQILAGALAPDNLPNTLNWAVPLVGMTLVAAIPLRGGMINLGVTIRSHVAVALNVSAAACVS